MTYLEFFDRVRQGIGDLPPAQVIPRVQYEAAIELGLHASFMHDESRRESAIESFRCLGKAMVPGFAFWVSGFVVPSLIGKQASLNMVSRRFKIGALALTEPAGGSDFASAQTRAEKCGENFVINGRKRFISLGRTADFFVVSASVGPTYPGLFLVEASQPGLNVTAIATDFAMMGLDLAEISFEDVYCPAKNVVASNAVVPLIRAMALERFIASSVAFGMLATILQELQNLLARSRQTEFRLADRQVPRLAVADISVLLRAADSRLEGSRRRFVEGRRLDLAETSECKLFVTRALLHAASLWVELSGADGITGQARALRALADAHAQCVYGGTNTVLREIVASKNLGAV